MNENIKAGADIHAGDGGYSIGNQEDHDAFVKQRNESLKEGKRFVMEEVAKRELNWWEHYPLHQLWCNDLCPLVPRFEYREGDEWNANNWSLHWLIFHIWTLEHFSFGVDVNIQPDSLSFGFIVPYFRVIIGFHHVWSLQWPFKLSRMLRRKPALKNDKGEYN